MALGGQGCVQDKSLVARGKARNYNRNGVNVAAAKLQSGKAHLCFSNAELSNIVQAGQCELS